MKTRFLYPSFILIFLLATLSSYAQTSKEEYNYVVKGYKIQVESGLDMKKGYALVDIDEVAAGERKAALKKLIKEDAPNEVVACMIIYQKGKEPAEYICVPRPDSEKEIVESYWKSLYKGEGDSSLRLQLVSYLLSRSLF